ncbi:hypothetical protein GWI33_007099 [Rhynchophorus ferrugineus]|uniref:Uncharacterized protein n=1 Tax=Rhynchophorus ferrugineus TaxID=354439 RepID=A0A834II78_RHYFE|nr:hypothetical protein GWI33_007099 [Rhynchophorus ferrugineus]
MLVSRITNESLSIDDVQIKESDIGQPCTQCNECKEGFKPHVWRKTCKNCKCTRDGHEITTEYGAKSRLGFVGHNGLDARTLGYSFVPPGLTTARQVDQYYSTLPSEEVPKLGSKGEALRLQRIVRQLPKQDLSLSACKFIDSDYETSYKDFVTGRNEVALDVGIAKPSPPNSVCANCSSALSPQQIAVTAPRLGNLVWHPACFKCTTCNDILVDLAYCTFEDEIYCERHYAEKLKPRCAGCDEVS